MSTNSQCPPTPIATNDHQRKRQFQSNFRPAISSIAIVIDGIDDIDDCWTLRVDGQSRHPATRKKTKMKRPLLLLPLLASAQ